MTSNQAIVLAELSKPEHQSIIQEAVELAKKDTAIGSTKVNNISQIAVDWMTIKLGLRVLPHLDPKGFVHAQTLPSAVYSTTDTVAHALQLVRLYGVAGVPQNRVCIKIPSTIEGLRACKILEKEHDVRTLATTVFSVAQALAAAEEANCTYAAPYVNPLRVHFVEGTHVIYENPVEDMPGIRVTAEIQRQYRRRKVKTQLMAASLVTAVEAISLSGVDHVTVSPAILQILANNPVDDKFQDLRDRAIASYSPDHNALEGLPLEAHFPLEWPAEALSEVMVSPKVKELMSEALFHFGVAEKKLLELAEAALQKLKD